MRKTDEELFQEKYKISNDLFETIIAATQVNEFNKKMIRISDENAMLLEDFMKDLRNMNYKVSMPKVVNAFVSYHLKYNQDNEEKL